MATLSRLDRLFTSRRGRTLQENLTAYVFLGPAMLLIFLFGIFPVGFAFFVSLHRWRRFPGNYLGMDNYTEALDSFAYVLFFWLALGLMAFAVFLAYRLWQKRSERSLAISFAVPGLINMSAILAFINWVAIVLPIILDIPNRVRGQERVPGLFLGQLGASFQYPEAASAGNTFLILGIAALIASLLWLRVVRVEERTAILLRWTAIAVAVAVGALLLQLTIDAIQAAAETAQNGGDTLPIWSQIIFISAGVGLIAGAFLVWQRALKQDAGRRFGVLALAAVLLVIGGYALAAELPRALASADPDVLGGLNITVMFAVGTVPFQLAIGLGLAYLLFQNIKGRTFFRIVYFMPYIMPFVATSIVFGLIFSFRPESIANHLLGAVGIPPQKWLTEPIGVFTLIFGPSTPSILTGPSLALIVIMLYTTWTYIGYDAVVFLAGLGNVSPELYEAARIDGASGWSIFRYITLPLLSPTTFFLSLIAIIGTFQAFTQIWIMRTPASQRAVDTLGVHIFETVRSTDPNMGYGSAMAFVLFGVILLLTVVQNRIAGSRVFYG